MKACPYCAEMIQNSATKCRYCREMLPDEFSEPVTYHRFVAGPPCPQCGARELLPGPWPWYLGTIGVILVRAVICNRCGHHFDAKKPQADLAKRKRNLAILLNGIGGAGILAIVGGMVALVASL